MASAAAPVLEVPQIVDWTILPAGVTAQAWTDPEFRARLLQDPTSVLQERLPERAAGKTFVVMADTDNVKYYALPQLGPDLADASREDIMRILDHEMGDHDVPDEEWLPKAVIADALVDPDFKAQLLTDAAAALKARGYPLPARRVVVLENTRNTYHVVLIQNPSAESELNFEQLRTMLRERFGPSTTRCCPTGTCT